jgi:hypothetical protein
LQRQIDSVGKAIQKQSIALSLCGASDKKRENCLEMVPISSNLTLQNVEADSFEREIEELERIEKGCRRCYKAKVWCCSWSCSDYHMW